MALSEIYNLIFISRFLCNKDCSRIPPNPEYVIIIIIIFINCNWVVTRWQLDLHENIPAGC